MTIGDLLLGGSTVSLLGVLGWVVVQSFRRTAETDVRRDDSTAIVTSALRAELERCNTARQAEERAHETEMLAERQRYEKVIADQEARHDREVERIEARHQRELALWRLRGD